MHIIISQRTNIMRSLRFRPIAVLTKANSTNAVKIRKPLQSWNFIFESIYCWGIEVNRTKLEPNTPLATGTNSVNVSVPASAMHPNTTPTIIPVDIIPENSITIHVHIQIHLCKSICGKNRVKGQWMGEGGGRRADKRTKDKTTQDKTWPSKRQDRTRQDRNKTRQHQTRRRQDQTTQA
jgi:hypothetical protein